MCVARRAPSARRTRAGRVHGYKVTLGGCGCLDFLDRKLPCKHIYAAALTSQIVLPFSDADYEAAKKQDLEIVFEFQLGS